MKNIFGRIYKDIKGSTAVEYALLIGLCAVVFVAGMGRIGQASSAQLNTISNVYNSTR